MKFFIVFALCVAAASAFAIPPNVVNDVDKIQEILDAINHPSTDPATAAALEQMLQDLFGVHPSPVIIDDSPISVGPAIVDEDSPIGVGPAIVEEDAPISVGPAIIDESIVSEPATIPSPPIVQVIINVNGNNAGNPVVVEKPEIVPTPVIVVEQPEIEPTPVIVIEESEAPEPVIVAPVIIPEEAEVKPEPVIVAPIVIPEEAEVKPEPVIVAPVIIPEEINVKPEPVIVAPIEPTPVINLPESLN